MKCSAAPPSPALSKPRPLSKSASWDDIVLRLCRAWAFFPDPCCLKVYMTERVKFKTWKCCILYFLECTFLSSFRAVITYFLSWKVDLFVIYLFFLIPFCSNLLLKMLLKINLLCLSPLFAFFMMEKGAPFTLFVIFISKDVQWMTIYIKD